LETTTGATSKKKKRGSPKKNIRVHPQEGGKRRYWDLGRFPRDPNLGRREENGKSKLNHSMQ